MIPVKKEAYDLIHDGVLALSHVEQQGLRVDTAYIAKKKKEISDEIKQLELDIYDSDFYRKWSRSTKKGSKVNIYSGQQLSTYLYKTKGLRIPKETASGQGSTDEESLKKLGIPELDTLLRIKKLKKIRDTYLKSFEREADDGGLHPFFNLHTVRSFRSSSDRPNFQNIPARDSESVDIVRKAIYPREGHQLLEVDYSQLEVRIAASYCKDEKLIHDIIKGDMHRDMAIEIFKIGKFDSSIEGHTTLRKATKNGFVFPQFYGDYYENCAEHLACTWGGLPKTTWNSGMGIPVNGAFLSDHLIENGIRSYKTFVRHIQNIESDFWEKRYFAYNQWRETTWKRYQREGYVGSKTGFVYRGLMKRNDVINYPIQGSAFHCLLWSLIEVVKAQRRDRWDTKVIGQIHDSIVLDVNPHELDQVLKILECIMCNDVRQHWPWIIVPLEIEAELSPVDGSWADKKPYEIHKK
jgi:DNA polymerase I